MNTLSKLTVLASLLFLSGCAHHTGYYSGRSGSSAYGVSANSYYVPNRSYTIYRNQDVYLQAPQNHRQYYGKPHYKKHGKTNRYIDTNYSKRNYDGRYIKHYDHKRRGEKKRNHINRWNSPATYRNQNVYLQAPKNHRQYYGKPHYKKHRKTNRYIDTNYSKRNYDGRSNKHYDHKRRGRKREII